MKTGRVAETSHKQMQALVDLYSRACSRENKKTAQAGPLRAWTIVPKQARLASEVTTSPERADEE